MSVAGAASTEWIERMQEDSDTEEVDVSLPKETSKKMPKEMQNQQMEEVQEVAANPVPQKKRMSKAERNRMKKARSRGETGAQMETSKQEPRTKRSGSAKSEHYVEYSITAQQDFEAQR